MTLKDQLIINKLFGRKNRLKERPVPIFELEAMLKLKSDTYGELSKYGLMERPLTTWVEDKLVPLYDPRSDVKTQLTLQKLMDTGASICKEDPAEVLEFERQVLSALDQIDVLLLKLYGFYESDEGI